MAEIIHGNWSFRDPVDEVHDGDTITGGNFSQLVAGTEILKGLRLTITGGNWCNVKPQPEWTITGGSWAEFEYCAHESPRLVAKGLPAEIVACKHRSPDRSWQRTDVERFKAVKDNALTADDARIITKKDAYGLPDNGDGDVQELVYTYRGISGRLGAEVLAAAGKAVT